MMSLTQSTAPWGTAKPCSRPVDRERSRAVTAASTSPRSVRRISWAAISRSTSTSMASHLSAASIPSWMRSSWISSESSTLPPYPPRAECFFFRRFRRKISSRSRWSSTARM